jgi:uncharacterized protein (DUF486 family)
MPTAWYLHLKMLYHKPWYIWASLYLVGAAYFIFRGM